MKRIIPSVASANQLFLAEEIGAFPAGTLLHVDIEDGNFVLRHADSAFHCQHVPAAPPVFSLHGHQPLPVF